MFQHEANNDTDPATKHYPGMAIDTNSLSAWAHCISLGMPWDDVASQVALTPPLLKVGHWQACVLHACDIWRSVSTKPVMCDRCLL